MQVTAVFPLFDLTTAATSIVSFIPFPPLPRRYTYISMSMSIVSSTMMSVPHVAPSHDAYRQTIRRKVRKDAHSCWECKRRKMKCRFDPRIVSASCNGCRRRGSPCISQEFPEDLAYVPMGLGSSRAATPSERADPSILTALSTNMEPPRYHKPSEVRLLLRFFPQSFFMIVLLAAFQQYLTTTGNDTSPPKYARLSLFLHQLLPSRDDIESICIASCHSSILSHELLIMPYATLYQNGLQTPTSLLMTPEPNMHPVLIARHMLRLALFLQHLPPGSSQGDSRPVGTTPSHHGTFSRCCHLSRYH
jgi:hypothetical protein